MRAQIACGVSVLALVALALTSVPSRRAELEQAQRTEKLAMAISGTINDFNPSQLPGGVLHGFWQTGGPGCCTACAGCAPCYNPCNGGNTVVTNAGGALLVAGDGQTDDPVQEIRFVQAQNAAALGEVQSLTADLNSVEQTLSHDTKLKGELQDKISKIKDENLKLMAQLQEVLDKPGEPGAPGPPGPRGPAGPRGDAGPPGVALRGPVGYRGVPGPPGLKGPEGKVGKEGRQGPQGKPGRNGIDGPDGLDGVNGKDSTRRGPTGPPGPPGKPGPKGMQGEVGRKGVPGKPGLRGATGPIGKQGPPGAVGVAGYPGMVVPYTYTGYGYNGYYKGKKTQQLRGSVSHLQAAAKQLSRVKRQASSVMNTMA